MKIHKAKSIVHQHGAASAELEARRRALVIAEQQSEALGTNGAEALLAVLGVDERSIQQEMIQLQARLDDVQKQIAAAQQRLISEPIEQRAAKQHVITCKERIAAQHRVVDKWAKDLAEAQAEMKSFSERCAASKAVEESARRQALAGAIEETRAMQLAGKIPADVDVVKFAEDYFNNPGVQRKAEKVLRQHLKAKVL